MPKQRRRVVPVRQIRLERGEDGWASQSMLDRPPRPVPASAQPPDASAFWVEAVDRKDVVLHRVLLERAADGTVEIIVPIDARCVRLDLFDGEPGTEPVATFNMTGGGSGAPVIRR